MRDLAWSFLAVGKSTQQHRTDVMTQASAAPNWHILDHARDATLVLDEAGRVVFANVVVEPVLGYAATELVGRPLRRLLARDHRASLDLLQGDREPLALCVSRKDGVEVPVEMSVWPVTSTDGRFTVVALRDVSERVLLRQRATEAEALAQERESRFRDLADQAPVMIGMTDAEGRITFLNKTWLEFRGKTLQEEEGWAWAAGLHPEDRARTIAEMSACIARRASYSVEYRIEDRDGRYHWLLDKAAPRFASHGTYLGYIGTAVVIDGMKQLESALRGELADKERVLAELRNTEFRLAEAHRLAGLGTWELNLATDEVWWSREQHRLYGTEPGEVITHARVRDLVHPDDLGCFDRAVQAARDLEQSDHTYRIVRTDGAVRHLRGTARLTRDHDGRPRLHGTNLDITESIEAAETLHRSLEAKATLLAALHATTAELRVSQREYQSLFDEAIEGIFRVQPDGTIVRVNPAFAELVGYDSPEELRGVSKAGFYLDSFERLRRQLHEDPSGVRAVEAVWHKKSGELVTVELFGRERRDQDGRLVGYKGFVHDVTEVRLRAAREQQLLEANRAKTDFLASMSHELRTPLNAVLGLSEALLERVYGELTEKQAHSLRTIHESGKHLLLLINDVLDIARVEAGKLALNASDVSVEPLFTACVAVVQESARAKRHCLTTTLDSGVSTVRADQRRLRQVLLNLLTNAIKFCPPSGTITLGATRLAAEQAVELWVSDTGPGIPQQERQRIFDPFVTLPDPLGREHDGVGLGLSLVQRIVELHGGRIRVEGASGGGSRFVLTLPQSCDAPGVQPDPLRPAGAPQEARSQGGVILVVEDNDANLDTVVAYLQAKQFEVRTVRDGISAVSAALAQDVDLVLMDVRLPGIDGIEATRRIRAAERGRYTPIVAVTAHAMLDDEQRCLAAGFTSYLPKPIELRTLMRTVEHLIGRRPS